MPEYPTTKAEVKAFFGQCFININMNCNKDDCKGCDIMEEASCV